VKTSLNTEIFRFLEMPDIEKYIFFIADLHFLGILDIKNMIWAKKKISVCHAP
jgi:hypothetical protein